MIRLDKEISIKSSQKKNQPTNSSIKEIALFSHKVLKKIESEGVPTTPYNFTIYFEAMLEKSENSFKESINEIRSEESNIDDQEHHIQIEKEIRGGFSSLKSMIKSISNTYKHLSLLKQYIEKTNNDINSSNNQIATIDIVSSFKTDMGKFNSSLSTQLDTLKKDYEKTVVTLKSMESKAIYDTRFEVYNKKYLLKSLLAEKQAIINHNHKSSLMALKIKDAILQKALSGKNQFLLNKHISKLLQKTSRRSDIVAHFGDGTFFMLLKHTNLEDSKLACQRISSLIYDSSFFVEGNDIEMDLEIAVASINAQTSPEECISLLLNAMPESSRDGLIYKVVEDSNENEESFE